MTNAVWQYQSSPRARIPGINIIEKLKLGRRFRLSPKQGAYLVDDKSKTGIWTVVSEKPYHQSGEERVAIMSETGSLEIVGTHELLGLEEDNDRHFKDGKYIGGPDVYIERPDPIWIPVDGIVAPEKVIKQRYGRDLSEWELVPYADLKEHRKMLRTKSKGWKHEPARHALSAKGIKTKRLIR